MVVFATDLLGRLILGAALVLSVSIGFHIPSQIDHQPVYSGHGKIGETCRSGVAPPYHPARKPPAAGVLR